MNLRRDAGLGGTAQRLIVYGDRVPADLGRAINPVFQTTSRRGRLLPPSTAFGPLNQLAFVSQKALRVCSLALLTSFAQPPERRAGRAGIQS